MATALNGKANSFRSALIGEVMMLAPGNATKVNIVSELGEQRLLLPSLVNTGLEANDRAKYLISLLQSARTHADIPEAAAPNLQEERQACGISDSSLDTVVAGGRRENATDLLRSWCPQNP